MTGEIIAGYDGTPASAAAVEWAAGEAAARGVPLTVCHAWEIPYSGSHPGLVAYPAEVDWLERAARTVLDEGVERARATAPGAVITPALVHGFAAEVLSGLAGETGLLVVGSGGGGGLAELLGAVSARLAARAAGPVVVVRNLPEGAGPVVAAVDGSAEGDAALGFAFEAAAVYGAPLTAVCVLDPGRTTLREPLPYLKDLDLAGLTAERLDRAADRHRAAHPGVTATVSVRAGDPVEEVLAEAAGARLVVAGSRGLGAVRGRLLGSVSRGLLRGAACPVAVVHS